MDASQIGKRAWSYAGVLQDAGLAYSSTWSNSRSAVPGSAAVSAHPTTPHRISPSSSPAAFCTGPQPSEADNLCPTKRTDHVLTAHPPAKIALAPFRAGLYGGAVFAPRPSAFPARAAKRGRRVVSVFLRSGAGAGAGATVNVEIESPGVAPFAVPPARSA